MAFIPALRLMALLLLLPTALSTQFTVGGSSGWAVPSNTNAAFNQWAERLRFKIGDSLLFVYPSISDSLLRVTKDDYTNCNTASPVHKYTDGHTVIKLSDSGPHYFISGNKDSCKKNEKMVVVVLADRSKTSSSPAPAPSTSSSPSPAPSVATLPPSPAPSIATSPPAPAPVIPSPAPTGENSPPSPPPDAPSTPAPATNTAFSIAGSVGLIAASVALLAAL